MNNPLFVIAKITPKAEHFEQAKTAITDIVERTLEEGGCRQFSVYQSDASLFLYEEWEDQAALDEHYAMPYIAPVFEAYEEWLATPVEINKLSRLR
ncbi:MAG: putative quinol monooxygenase [Sneathiella sp.]